MLFGAVGGAGVVWGETSREKMCSVCTCSTEKHQHQRESRPVYDAPIFRMYAYVLSLLSGREWKFLCTSRRTHASEHSNSLCVRTISSGKLPMCIFNGNFPFKAPEAERLQSAWQWITVRSQTRPSFRRHLQLRAILTSMNRLRAGNFCVA